MNITGKLTREAGSWKIKDISTGKVYALNGGDFPERIANQTVRVVGVAEDSFGGGILTDDIVIVVQQWKVV